MAFKFKRWWRGIGLATLALELLCLAISPNPISILLIPLGTALFGGAAPILLFEIRDAMDTRKDELLRFVALGKALSCLGFAITGASMVAGAIAVALFIMSA